MVKYQQLLEQSGYDKDESEFLINGFKEGFDIGYQGPENRQSQAHNIPFTPGVGCRQQGGHVE